MRFSAPAFYYTIIISYKCEEVNDKNWNELKTIFGNFMKIDRWDLDGMPSNLEREILLSLFRFRFFALFF